jgi:simple sugar transport system permease protein
MIGTHIYVMASFLDVFARAGMWQGAVALSAPLILAAVGGCISERSGVVNVAMEGMMLMAAFFAAYASDKVFNVFHWPAWAASSCGVAMAIVVGALTALMLAWTAIRWRANQIVVGVAINLIALGFTSFLFLTVYGQSGTPGNLPGIPNSNLPVLSGIKFLALGSILFQQNVILYVAFIVVVAAYIFLFRSRLGLRIRSVGEHPRAADSAGIDVQGIRYLAVMLSGALSGLAGAYLALQGLNGLFAQNMTGGRGFIALAAMIVGKWNPFGAAAACLLFAVGEQLAFNWQGLSIGSYQLSDTQLDMLPYLLTIIAVAGLIGRSTPPAADGIPYDPAESA